MSEVKSSDPSTYVIFDAHLLQQAVVGEAQARTRNEAVNGFADGNIADESGVKAIASFPKRQFDLALDSAIEVSIETKPVLTKRPLRSSGPAPTPQAEPAD